MEERYSDFETGPVEEIIDRLERNVDDFFGNKYMWSIQMCSYEALALLRYIDKLREGNNSK